MQNLIAAVELAKENGYNMTSLSEALGHNKNYISRLLSRGVSETTAETVTSEIEQLLAGAAPKQDKDKALKQALKTIELQGVAFQELDCSYNDLKSSHNALKVKLRNVDRHAAKLEENTIELAQEVLKLKEKDKWQCDHIDRLIDRASQLSDDSKKYKRDAKVAGMFAAFFGFVSASLLVALIYMVV